MKRDTKQPMFERNFDEKYYKEVAKLVKHYESNSAALYDENSLEKIIDFYEENNELDKALSAADDAINQYPFSATFMVKKAQIFFDLKQFDQANDLLDKALVLDSQNIQIYLLQSDIQVWLGQFQLAINIILDAITILDDKDETPDLYLELADIYEEWEKYDKVFEALTATLHHDPKNEEALNRLWFCVELSENFDASIEFHKAFIDENPYSHLAWFNLAHAYVGIGEFDNAVEAFEFVIAIDEEYEYAYKDCADVLMLTLDFDKAIDYYLQAISMSKPQKELYIKLGECYEAKGEYQRARSYYRKAANLDPYFDEAYNKIGQTYLLEDRPEVALPMLQKACDLLPDCSLYLTDIAEAYKAVEAFDLADKYFNKAILADDQKTAEIHLQWAESKLIEGDFKSGLEILDEAEGITNKLTGDFFVTKFVLLYLDGQKQSAYLLMQKLLENGKMNYSKALDLYPLLDQDPRIIAMLESYV